ncbi:alpha/beta fold hydrolase [Microbulbifer variabilis]|uniref:Alpha/beta fold hydrolase n=1 Tax=Microbulbifer variabilis TaxID=266805 RepID=A0ABY4VC49_9GAMM|nr:alpha/beta fold hydrolase [Microbulbifer variabilis]USD21853.1 alpha/beta fold hydrolase [Microbulbifer variabilis]
MPQETHNLSFGAFQVPVTTVRNGEGPLVLVIPAMGVPANRYHLLLQELQRLGYSTAITELPGTGESLPRPNRNADYGYDDLVFAFIPQLLALLEESFPAGPALILGHSIGGQTSTLAARAGLTGNARVVTIASGHVDHRSWSGLHRYAILLFASIVSVTSSLLGYFPGARMGFGWHEARKLMKDWARSIFSGRFAPEKRFGKHKPNSQPTLHIALAGDPFAPVRAARKLAAIVDGETREMAATYPKGNPHLSWIKNPRPIIAEVDNWLTQHPASSY